MAASVNTVRMVERLNYLFGGLLIIGSVFVATQKQALGLAIGVALTCLNFAVLRGLVYKWTKAVQAGEPSGSKAFLVMPKMIGMMAAVVVVILFLPVDAIAFLIGYSIFFPSIVVAGVVDALRSARDESADSADTKS
ncbi:MAG: hypothetical protein F9K40_01620 [Kofleriaceae bacterium]|nr:MAG: hypothetical protein F9K40_01620 [Kofleriaceae bacterium]MBZ0233576.1 ATP synthase subunit I [Kofleriaceae bacterium]